jgi:hypothetical protein
MSIDDFMERVESLVSYIGFEYKDIVCGIDPLSRSHFDMWYGDEYYKAESIDDVMNYPLFDGKPLTEIFEEITDLEY